MKQMTIVFKAVIEVDDSVEELAQTEAERALVAIGAIADAGIDQYMNDNVVNFELIETSVDFEEPKLSSFSITFED